MADVGGYILRIATEEWVNQVFNLAIYYTSSRRGWKTGQRIIFVHKTKIGDAFVEWRNRKYLRYR